MPLLPFLARGALPLAIAAGAAVVGTILARRRAFSLAGKNVLVTGGARGLGLEIARILVHEGANVAIVARDEASIARAVEELEALAKDAGRGGGKGSGSGRVPTVHGVSCDLRDAAAIDGMLATVRSALGPIDVLVNDAGAIEVGPLDAMTPADFERAMQLHCFAPLRTTLGVREEMRRRGGGRIANVASIGGVVAIPHLLPYSASKFALVGLSRGLHTELAADGIAVTTIMPGLMRTGSPRNASFKGDHDAEYAWFAVADATPFLSMDSRRAATRIVRAIVRGEAELVLGLPAKIAAVLAGVAPSALAYALTVTNALLPHGDDPEPRPGHASEAAVPSALTRENDRAAARNNEL